MLQANTETVRLARFACGEPGHYVHCFPSLEYCKLVSSSHAHAYSCEPDPSNCATYPQASTPYACGCFSDGDVTFVTICE